MDTSDNISEFKSYSIMQTQSQKRDATGTKSKGKSKNGIIVTLIFCFMSIFGILLFAFVLLSQFNGSNQASGLVTTESTDVDLYTDEKQTKTVDISTFWSKNAEYPSQVISAHAGYYNDVYIYCQISRFEIEKDVITLYDYTGNVWFKYAYYKNGHNVTSTATNSGSWLMYVSDSNGRITTTPANTNTRRLQRDSDDDGDEPGSGRRRRILQRGSDDDADDEPSGGGGRRILQRSSDDDADDEPSSGRRILQRGNSNNDEPGSTQNTCACSTCCNECNC